MKKFHFNLFFFTLIPYFLWAQLDERVSPREPQKDRKAEDFFPDELDKKRQYDNTPIIPRTKGLVLTKPGMKLSPEDVAKVEGVQFVDLVVPGNPETLKKHLRSLFLDQPLTMQKIFEIKKNVIKYYQSVKHPVVSVLVPEQDVTEGVLTLYVLESKVGKVKMEGNDWFGTEKLQEYVKLQEYQDIDSNVLVQDLYWLNRNPFRTTNVILKPGEFEETTDVEFWTKDRLPLRIYAGIENTGFEQTGRGRLFSGVNWGNAFGADQILSYQYTTSTDFGKFHAHTAHWTIPIQRWRHIVEFFGGYSTVRPKMPVKEMKNDGWSMQVSGRYSIPFNLRRKYLHELTFGADFKKTDNNIFFVLTPLIANTVVVTQLMAAYNGSFNNDFNKTSFEVELFWSPGDIFPHQSNADYQELRPFAESNYVYLKGHLFTILQLSYDFSFSINSQFQIANQNLLPTEQYGIGGYSTVRGYDEREINVDNAFLLSSELRTPPVRILKLFRPNTKIPDVFQFLAFLDYGIGSNHKRISGEQKSEYLLSFGPGIRYNLDVYLTFRADLGFKFHKTRFNEDKSGKRFHFSLLISY